MLTSNQADITALAARVTNYINSHDLEGMAEWAKEKGSEYLAATIKALKEEYIEWKDAVMGLKEGFGISFEDAERLLDWFMHGDDKSKPRGDWSTGDRNKYPPIQFDQDIP